MDQKVRFFRTHKKATLLIGILTLVLFGLPLTVVMLQRQQIFQEHAWYTAQSATAVCGSGGTAVITVRFTNTEPSGSDMGMNVIVRDTVTGGTVDLGTVNPGDTKTGTITTTQSSLSAGGVIFTLTWSNGSPGADTRDASYPAVAACAQPSPSPSPSSTPTPSPTLSPSNTPTPTSVPTPTPTSVPSATPTSVPSATPTSVPSATPTSVPTATPTSVPTATPTNGPTATPTNPPPPGSTATPTSIPTATPTNGPTATPTNPPPPGSTATPTAIATIVQNTPRPTIRPTGPETFVVGFGAAAIVLTVIGGLLVFLL